MPKNSERPTSNIFDNAIFRMFESEYLNSSENHSNLSIRTRTYSKRSFGQNYSAEAQVVLNALFLRRCFVPLRWGKVLIGFAAFCGNIWRPYKAGLYTTLTSNRTLLSMFDVFEI